MSQSDAVTKPREISAARADGLEKAIPDGWPDVWRDFALSVFTTLVVLENWAAMSGEDLAMEVVKGIGQDLGGTQPYLPAGYKTAARDRTQLVLSLLASGVGYRQVALKAGLTESRVRKIEAIERRKRRAAARAAGK